MPDNMDPSQADRLNELQMADLGTARREHVSTMDDPKKISRVRMEDLEAQRASNIRGTASQREAAQKQPALDAWKNLSKIMDDTGGLERLANIMQGQSHRSSFNAAIAGYGGQNYDQPKSSKGSKSAVTAAVTAAIPQALRNVQTKPSSLSPRSDTSSPEIQSVKSESWIGRYPVHPAYTSRAGRADAIRGRGRAIRGPHDPPVAKKQNQRSFGGCSTGSSGLDPALELHAGMAGSSRRNISSKRIQGTRHIAPREARPNFNSPTIGSPAEFLAQLQAIGAKFPPVQVAPAKASEAKDTTDAPKAAQEASQLIQKSTDKVSRIESAPSLDVNPQSVPAMAESTETPATGSLPVVGLPLVKEAAIAHEEPSKVSRGVVSFRIPQVVENSSQPKVPTAIKSLLDESPDDSPTKPGDLAHPFETEGLVILASTPTKGQDVQLSDSKAADVKHGLLVDFYKHNQEVTQASPMTPSTLADLSGLDFVNEPEPKPKPEHDFYLETPELSTSSQDLESSGILTHGMTDEERITKFAQAAKELLETPNAVLHIPKKVLNFLRQSVEVANVGTKGPEVSDSKTDSSSDPIKVDSATGDPSKEKEFSQTTSTQRAISDTLHAKEMSIGVAIESVQEKTDTWSLGSATLDKSSLEIFDFESPARTPGRASPSVSTKPRPYTPERFASSNSFRDYRDREPTPSTGDSRKEKFFDAQQEINSSPKKKAESASANDDSKLIGKFLETFQFSDSSAPASQKHSRNTSEDSKTPEAKKLKPETITPASAVVSKTNSLSPAQLHASRCAVSKPDPDTLIPKIPGPPAAPPDRIENDWTKIEMAEEEDKKHRAGSIEIKAVAPKPNSLSESIYARDWNLHHQLGKAKVIGPAPYNDDKRFCRVVEVAVNARPGSVSSHKSFESRVSSSSEKDIPDANLTMSANNSSWQSTSQIPKSSIQPTHKGAITIGPPPYNTALKNVLKSKPSTQGASQSVPAAATALKGVRTIGPSGSFNPGFRPTGIPTPNTPYSVSEKTANNTKAVNPLPSAKPGIANERSVTGDSQQKMSVENDPFMDIGGD